LIRGKVKLGGVVESWGGGVFVMFTVIVCFCRYENPVTTP